MIRYLPMLSLVIIGCHPVPPAHGGVPQSASPIRSWSVSAGLAIVEEPNSDVFDAEFYSNLGRSGYQGCLVSLPTKPDYCACISTTILSNMKATIERYNLSSEQELWSHMPEIVVSRQQAEVCLLLERK